MQQGDDRLRLHASAVALESGAALLILGPSGSGKSALALELMALGAVLVSDDQVDLQRDGADIWLSAPGAIRGRIEARQVGILSARTLDRARLCLAVDMAETETDRLPPRRSTKLLGVAIPLLHNVDKRHFPASILQYLMAGRSD